MKLVRTIVVLTVGAVLALPTAAHADTSPSVDAHGDVQSIPIDGDDTASPAAAPNRAQGDITGVKVTHATNTVRVLVRFRELNRTGPLHSHQFLFKTATRKRWVSLDAGTGHWAGKPTTYNGSGTKVRCAVSRTIDYNKNTVLVVVPRSCLGKPRWVRAGAGTITTYSDKLYYDDGFAPNGSFDDELVLGPRVYR